MTRFEIVSKNLLPHLGVIRAGKSHDIFLTDPRVGIVALKGINDITPERIVLIGPEVAKADPDRSGTIVR